MGLVLIVNVPTIHNRVDFVDARFSGTGIGSRGRKSPSLRPVPSRRKTDSARNATDCNEVASKQVLRDGRARLLIMAEQYRRLDKTFMRVVAGMVSH